MVTRSIAGIFVVASLAVLQPLPAFAQMNGENMLGDNGAKSGTQAPPGFYVGFIYYRYDADTVKDANGNVVTVRPTDPASTTINASLPLFMFVSKTKVLGANYGVIAAMPFANASLEAPGFGFQSSTGAGPADLYIVPIQLGWHMPRADVLTSFGFFAPTGRFTAGAKDNVGKGMWSYETAGGATVYFDEKKTISVATTAYWEVHTAKQGTGNVVLPNATLTGVKVGQLMTLEGGFGKSFLGGAASVGLAYYAQFKLTRDQFGILSAVPAVSAVNEHQVWGFGPDVTVPVASKSKLFALVNIRYFWEAAARVKTQGQSLVITTTFMVPSVMIRK